MEKQVLRQLNPTPGLIDLVKRIEKYADLELAVEERPGDPSHILSHEGATIYFEDIHAIPPQAMLHELLHIERTWLEKIPMFDTRDPAHPDRQFIADLDNRIEHLAIVPKESNYGFDRYAKWNNDAREWLHVRKWEKYETVGELLPNLMLHWLSTESLVNDDAVRNQTIKVLRDYNIYNQAQTFTGEIAASKESKEAMTSVMVRTLGIPVDAVHLLPQDVKSKQPSKPIAIAP